MQGTCIGLIRFYCSQVLALGLSIFLLIEIIFFIRQIFAPIMKIERKIDELERENKKSTCDGTEDKERPYGLLETIQLLLQKESIANIMKKQAEIDALQNQINPHFIYNTMEIFSSQMELYGHYEESDAMSSFAGMLRYNIRTNSPYAALQEELSQVTGYITLQKLRYPNISAEFAVPPMLLSIEIVRFLLQPLAENSIVHGMPNAGYPMRISVSAAPSDLGILFSVYDNGTGIPEEKAAELNAYFNDQTNYDDSSSSIGLNNINHRLRLFYGSASCLHIKQNSPIGCCVSFWIPLSQEPKAESHLSRPKVLL